MVEFFVSYGFWNSNLCSVSFEVHSTLNEFISEWFAFFWNLLSNHANQRVNLLQKLIGLDYFVILGNNIQLLHTWGHVCVCRNMPVTCLNQNKTRDKRQRSVLFTFIYLILSLPRNVNESHSKSLVSGKSHNTQHTPHTTKYKYHTADTLKRA